MLQFSLFVFFFLGGGGGGGRESGFQDLLKLIVSFYFSFSAICLGN